MFEAENASTIGSNLTAVEAISAKLTEVTRLAEKLDARLCEAGARIRPISIPTAATSSASSLLSISATSPSVMPTHTTSTTTAAASAIVQMHPMSSETAPAIAKSDVPKSVTSVAEKGDESSFHICSHSIEDVETSNENFDTKELVDNLRSESSAEEYNVESYATATECSTTPSPRSRSESLVTLPECLSTTALVTSSCIGPTRWAIETPKLTTMVALPASAPSNENQMLKFSEATSNISIIVGLKPTARIETMDQIIDERSGKIIKEVTETTVLRVSHDVRLGVASYKLASNFVQDHRRHIAAEDIQNAEHVLPIESREKTDSAHCGLDLSHFKESEKYIDKCPKKIHSDQNITKITKIQEYVPNGNLRSNLREYENISLSSQDLSRHHEDSGIEMSPMKKDNLEGEEFLKSARKLC